ncbi:tyrosine-type recombinase/integrase [Kitasatospora sp. NPDC001527]|uniref:tyrosine-type recombinase/integrase n=1 Tax=Kitasatospora sp. NPDC001527 TaxID=3154519 RepID=UPI00332D4868
MPCCSRPPTATACAATRPGCSTSPTSDATRTARSSASSARSWSATARPSVARRPSAAACSPSGCGPPTSWTSGSPKSARACGTPRLPACGPRNAAHGWDSSGWTPAFAAYRDAIGLDPALEFHSLRRSYISHLLEDGYDALFVQQQVGHEYASTTAIYTCVSSDYRTRTLRRALDAGIAAALGTGRTS